MITAVDFLALAAFEQVAVAPDMLAISLGDPGSPRAKNLGEFESALRLEFLDIEQEYLDVELEDPGFCSLAQLAELTAFIAQANKSQKAHRVVVHCHFGVRRSAAIALIVQALTGCDFPRRYGANFANRYILALAARTNIRVERPTGFEETDEYYLPSKLCI